MGVEEWSRGWAGVETVEGCRSNDTHRRLAAQRCRDLSWFEPARINDL